MSLHDAYARLTPYERFLPDPDFAPRRFPAIADEAERRGVSLDDPGVFAILESAADALGELRGDGGDTESFARHVVFLFHAWHHAAAGTPVRLVGAEALRALVADDWEPRGPAGETEPSVYVQLPQHMVWVRTEDSETPVSLDGAFRTLTGEGSLHVLAVGGVRPDRAGFTVVPVPAAPLADEVGWLTATMRSDGGDFSSTLPGADLDGLVELRTAGEILKLVARAVRLEAGGSAAPDPTVEPGKAPLPSTLPSRRLRVGA